VVVAIRRVTGDYEGATHDNPVVQTIVFLKFSSMILADM
jgi:hypothetical protein